jgi:hypothetical protein
LLLLGVPFATVGQQLSEVRLVNGRFDARYLPYARSFRIKGSRAIPAGDADAVRFTFKPIAGSGPSTARGDTTTSAACWVRPESYTGPEFELVVDRALTIDRSYSVTIEFFRRHAATELASAVVSGLERYASGLSSSGGFTDRELAATIDAELVDQFAGDQRVWLHVDTLGQCPTSTSVSPLRQLTTMQRDAFAAFVEDNLQLRLRIRRADTALQVLEGSRPVEFAAARERLVSMPAAQRQPAYSNQSVNELFTLLQNNQVPDTALSGLFRRVIERAETVTRLGRATVAAIDTMLSRADRLRARRAEVAEKRSELAIARDSLNKVTGNLQNVVNPGYLPAANARLSTISFTDTANYRKLRISTAFATGITVLGGCCISSGLDEEKGDAALDGVNMVLFKYYFGIVDKELRDPYVDGARSHFALNIGAVVRTDLTYHGQTLDDFFVSLKPVLGLSYDLSRFLAVHSGVLLYRQKSPNPFDNARRGRASMSPFFSVGFDFDLINQIAGLVRGGS